MSGSVDDRTKEERGLEVCFATILLENRVTFTQPLRENKYRIPKSRFDSVSLYISNSWLNRPEYSDTYVPYDPNIFGRLRDNGKPT